MNPYEVKPYVSNIHALPDDIWEVISDDDTGVPHITLFLGPMAEGRARAYADRMNEINNRHISFPHE